MVETLIIEPMIRIEQGVAEQNVQIKPHTKTNMLLALFFIETIVKWLFASYFEDLFLLSVLLKKLSTIKFHLSPIQRPPVQLLKGAGLSIITHDNYVLSNYPEFSL